jgi:phosphonate transport system substrate-binding protein
MAALRITARRVVLALLLLLAAPALAQWRVDNPVIRIGMIAGADVTASRGRAEPFRAYLEQALDDDVELFFANDYAALIAGQLTGRFHAAFLSATAFAAANLTCNACLEPAAIPTTFDGEEGFYSILVVPAGSGIADATGLPGARLAVSAPDSVAGRLLPLALFAEVGIDVSAIELVAIDSPDAAIELMLAGGADAALAWSSLAGDQATGYSRGVLRQLVDEGRVAMADLRVAWTSPLIPYGPLAVRTDLPAEMRAELSAAMVAMAAADPDALLAVNGALGGAFVAPPADIFQPLMLLVDTAR